MHFLDVYIAADRLCMEKLGNIVVDVVIKIYNRWWLDILSIEQLRIAELEDSRLYRYLLKRPPFDIQAHGWEEAARGSPCLEEDFREFPESTLALTTMLFGPSSIHRDVRIALGIHTRE